MSNTPLKIATTGSAVLTLVAAFERAEKHDTNLIPCIIYYVPMGLMVFAVAFGFVHLCIGIGRAFGKK